MRRSLIATLFLVLAACQNLALPSLAEPSPAETPAPAAEPPSAPPAGPTAERVRVPILMYHYIRINPNAKDSLGFSLSVTPSEFQKQMDWLQSNNRTPITLEELASSLQSGQPLPAHPVVLTFDDGYADFYSEALPVLMTHGFKAVAYIVSGFVGRPGYMSRQQVKAASDQGIVIGSHSVSHLDLASLGPGELARQVAFSRTELEALAGRPVLDFCYPSGRYTDAVVRAVAAAGYRDATTTAPGLDHTLADRFTWSRVRVSGGETLAQFAAALGASGGASATLSGRESARAQRSEQYVWAPNM
jgi:peptidoglycan/xylan/chitin deacetylase (PgdA/CDA1 family)